MTREPFAVRLSPSERARIERVAETVGLPLSTFVRRAALDLADRLLVEWEREETERAGP